MAKTAVPAVLGTSARWLFRLALSRVAADVAVGDDTDDDTDTDIMVGPLLTLCESHVTP